jgi:hypothetical protein
MIFHLNWLFKVTHPNAEVSDIHCGPSMKEFCHCLLQNCSPVPHFCAHHRCSVPVCSKQTISIMSSGCHDCGLAKSVPFPTFASRSRPTSQGSLVAFRVHQGSRSAVSNSNTMVEALPQSTGIVGEIAQSSFRCQSIFPAKKESCCQI